MFSADRPYNHCNTAQSALNWLDSPITLNMEQEKAMGFFVMNDQCGVFHCVRKGYIFFAVFYFQDS